MKNFRLLITPIAFVLSLLLSVSSYAQNEVVFEDQFNGSSVDFNSNWTYYGVGSGSINDDRRTSGLTNFNFQPYIATETGTSFVRLRFDTYNPSTLRAADGGRLFKGTEMYSRKVFGPTNGARVPDPSEKIILPAKESATGFEFEARLRYTDPNPGGIGAFWTYWNHGNDYRYYTSGYSSYEIDYELFPFDYKRVNSTDSHDVYHLHNYRDFYAGRTVDQNGKQNGFSTQSPYGRFDNVGPTGFDYTQWNYYKMVWTPQSNGGWTTQWFIRRNLSDSYTKLGELPDAPDKWMTLRFNNWNGGNGIAPANTASQNQTYFLDVDWVKVAKVAPVSASVTEVGGVAVSPSGTTTVPNLSVIKGQVAATSGAVSMINVVIRRLSDNTKWKGYADGNGPIGWVPDSQNVGTGTDNASPNWTTNGALPSGSNLTVSEYQISADVLSGGVYISSPIVDVRIESSNHAPVAERHLPAAGSSGVGLSYKMTSVYFDEDGADDIGECLIEIRNGSLSTQAIYNRSTDKLSLLQDNGRRSGGLTPGTRSVISNGLLALNCADTQVIVNQAKKQVVVNWSFAPKSPLLGTNDVNLDVFDASGAHPGFIKRATWTVSGTASSNDTPIPVAFSPLDGNSRVGFTYATISAYFDDNGYEDLDKLVVRFRMVVPGQAGVQETRAYYDRSTDKLYLLNDAKTTWVGGVVVGTPAPAGMLSNSLITLDCTNTSVFVSTARKQVQVRWNFIPKAGMVGTNDVLLEAIDVAGARSNLVKLATWTVEDSTAARSSTESFASDSENSQLEKTNSSSKTTDSKENPFVGEVPANGPAREFPITTKGDGTPGPPIDEGKSADSKQNAPVNPSAGRS